MTDIRIWDKARGHVHATLVAPDGADDQLVLAAMAVDAVLALGEGLFEPLSVDVEAACCDVEFGLPLTGPAARAHQLGLASLPETVRLEHVWTNTRDTRRERLDRTTVLDWFGTLLAEQECVDATPGWSELLVTSVRARLPEAVAARAENGRLRVGQYAGVIDFPVERLAAACWVAGPLAWNSDTSPFDVWIVNIGRALTLDFRVSWSVWIDGAGRPDVDAAGHRLSALGWDVQPLVVGGV